MIHRKLNTVFIPVADLKESVDWYAKVLGFEIDPVQYNEIEDIPVYTFQMGETSLTLKEEKGFTPPASNVPICNFQTTQIEKVREDFHEKKVQLNPGSSRFPIFHILTLEMSTGIY
ncbi:VOC family protein [Bacillus sp. CH30_1T]|uniref:VOC family protein n=1 Tax=Bacillus sp. CH30_1T TaxID=2604836 RepID=UPI0011EC99AE|nr:VOC family protein [Bacillus sp. CH30_1T]KAA0562550.1 VOC family protein [Bacillus sp. CH30_1T]